MLGLLRRKRHRRAGRTLYGAAVAAARDPWFYAELGVPDTLDGRFDLVGIHAYLLVRRLSRDAPPGPALAQAVFDAMFSDMDLNLREIGVSDLAVGKRMRDMWEAFHGRAAAYGKAMEADDRAALAAAVSRNVWRLPQDVPSPPGADALAGQIMIEAEALAGQDLAALEAGRVYFRGAPA